MASGKAVGILLGVAAITVILFAGLIFFLRRRRTPFSNRSRAYALSALEGGSVPSTSTSSSSLEKAYPSKNRLHGQSLSEKNASSLSVPSIIMTAALDGSEIQRPATAKVKSSPLRNSTLTIGEPGPEWKELGLQPPPSLSGSRRASRASKAGSILSIGGWKKRKTVRLTFFAM